jgi:hypothetical protein
MSRQYWVSPIPPFHVADGTALTGGTVLGELFMVPPIIIPGGTLEIGSRLEIQAFGKYTTTATQGSITMGLYIGPTATLIGSLAVMCVTSTLTPVASMTNRTWRLEANASVRTVGTGTAATVLTCAEITNVSGASPVCDTAVAPATGLAAVGFDSTVNNRIAIGVTPTVSTGSWQCMYMGVRLVN